MQNSLLPESKSSHTGTPTAPCFRAFFAQKGRVASLVVERNELRFRLKMPSEIDECLFVGANEFLFVAIIEFFFVDNAAGAVYDALWNSSP
jgi:hypothetical protein